MCQETYWRLLFPLVFLGLTFFGVFFFRLRKTFQGPITCGCSADNSNASIKYERAPKELGEINANPS
jgi:hypothetical protein